MNPNPTIHLFYNAADCLLPQGNPWEQFRNPDSPRVFSIAAALWERQGWAVKRLSTIPSEGCEYEATPFLPHVIDAGAGKPFGRCADSFAWYPKMFWQFIAKAKAVAKDPQTLYWFATTDVVNHGFSSDSIIFKALHNQPKNPGSICYNFQREHFSLSLIACNRHWLEAAEMILVSYDKGDIPQLKRDYVSDETILREYMSSINKPLMTFANNITADTFPLVHHARSTLYSTLHARELA